MAIGQGCRESVMSDMPPCDRVNADGFGFNNLFGGGADALQVNGQGLPRPPGPAWAVFFPGHLSEE